MTIYVTPKAHGMYVLSVGRKRITTVVLPTFRLNIGLPLTADEARQHVGDVLGRTLAPNTAVVVRDGRS